MSIISAFAYGGSKRRQVPHLRKPPRGARRIIEPYLGSGAYSLNAAIPAVGYEINRDICELWWWLQSASVQDIYDLRALAEERRLRDARLDVRELDIPHGARTLLRITICDMNSGKLAGYRVYPWAKVMPVANTLKALPHVKRIEVRHESGDQVVGQDGDCLFIDPPYVGTSSHYTSRRDSFDEVSLRRQVERANVPLALTYHRPDACPELIWHELPALTTFAVSAKVKRLEYVAYRNWRD